MSPEEQRATGRLMVRTAVVTALVIFVTGALLMRLLHITSGASPSPGDHPCPSRDQDAVGPQRRVSSSESPLGPGRRGIAVYPLAVPYLLNPVGFKS